MALPKALNLHKWIKDNQHMLKRPPVNNELIWKDADMMVMMVGGPNERLDYHCNPVEEFFYQLKGDCFLNSFDDDGQPCEIHIKEGEVLMLPAGTLHSPQRPDPDSVGLVVEPARPEGELDKLQWHCLKCHSMVHQIEAKILSIVKDLPAVYEVFHADMDARTCKQCGEVHPGKGKLDESGVA
ncbi:3-hydroxyanthranilate 3,4-dioxygenase [Shewanella eurypsychrophilus]|uniref:3-hydroxyanthranilate 3,4-dioxygenase n=1 Tax=Shewanella eurypsychrophilus TaxID=2593656 RepID=A0ABX6VC44_9GAMM|nr:MULTISPECIES: 3-hydroxyanthranilate 3,4-dioxygenase [Shewanella]QFU24389.1 3-hydroxyanthranilate 3,4-dioxygenase [Shewanella sp. YLB-09]QPG59589.1 3-hydroxyanthranilate 3,4-dioxygenase [Shewanella eurypsychrophilus]